MLAASLLGIFLIPSLYVFTERVARSERKLEAKLSHVADEAGLPLAEESR
jgi:hypothetical protein